MVQEDGLSSIPRFALPFPLEVPNLSDLFNTSASVLEFLDFRIEVQMVVTLKLVH